MVESLRRPVLAVALFAIGIFGVQAVAASTEAKADFCFGGSPFWECVYAGESIPKNTKRWFQAAVTERNWLENKASDGYGGSVYKCAGVKRASDGAINFLACGNGAQNIGGGIASNWRPGWVFIEQRAEGPRDMFGNAIH